MVTRRVAVALGSAVLAAGLLAACVTVPAPPDAAARAGFGRMAVVPASTPTGAPPVVIASGRTDAVARQTTPDAEREALAVGGVAAGTYAVIAPYPPLGALVIVSSVVIASAIEAAEQAPPRALATLDARLAAALADPPSAARLAEAVERAAAQHPEAQAHGLARDTPDPDTRLEVALRVAGFRGTDAGLRLYLIVGTRLRDRDGTLRHAREFLHTSALRPVADWQRGGMDAIHAELAAAIPSFAERIVDELFVVARMPFDATRFALPGQTGFGACGLAPLDPPLVVGWPRFVLPLTAAQYERSNFDLLEYPPVASLRPTLRWEPFPRPRDRTPRHAALIARIEAVTYDLRIWEAAGGEPQRLVYERRGLPAPEHAVEEPLAPARAHFWSFRARYRLDGAPQATRWAASSVPVPAGPAVRPGDLCERDAIPAANYYRFKTPGLTP